MYTERRCGECGQRGRQRSAQALMASWPRTPKGSLRLIDNCFLAAARLLITCLVARQLRCEL